MKRVSTKATAKDPENAPPPPREQPACPDDSEWGGIAAETGWTPQDCLAHKVTFAKRADAKAKVDTLAGHMKRLRAAGWHLCSEMQG